MHRRLGDRAVNNYQSGCAFINWHGLTSGVLAACWPTKAQMEFLFSCTVLEPDGRQLIRHYSVSVLLNWQCFITKSF